MPKIGLISDTHSYLDDAVYDYFKEVDEIWHLGDVGDVRVIEKLQDFKKVRGVYGNIDAKDVQAILPLDNRFQFEGFDVYMTHIGGYPGRYASRVRAIFEQHPPDIFLCGHSHILKVMRDKKYNSMMCINPGAAGKHGFHKVRTLLRLDIENKEMRNLEIVELGKRG